MAYKAVVIDYAPKAIMVFYKQEKQAQTEESALNMEAL